MKEHKTAQGKTIDIVALRARNERVRAVGNMNVNARGDTIDGFGNIIKSATEKAAERYQKTVNNKSANAKKPEAKPVIKEELTPEELELNAFDEYYDKELENIKKENK